MILSFNKYFENIDSAINESKKQEKYAKFFKAKLAEYDVDSPTDLSEEDKKEFFNKIQYGWVAGKGAKYDKELMEKESSSLKDDYEAYFKAKMLDYDIESPADLDTEEKRRFFKDVNDGWIAGFGEKRLNESDDETKYLTPGQRKLPEGLKKGIIAKMKKLGKNLDDKKDISNLK